jgi:hypothetical protein
MTQTKSRTYGLASNPSEWAAHRRAVVFTVRRMFPGVDAERAATDGLGELCRQIVVHGAVDRPAVVWCEAAIAAAARLRAQDGSPA